MIVAYIVGGLIVGAIIGFYIGRASSIDGIDANYYRQEYHLTEAQLEETELELEKAQKRIEEFQSSELSTIGNLKTAIGKAIELIMFWHDYHIPEGTVIEKVRKAEAHNAYLNQSPEMRELKSHLTK